MKPIQLINSGVEFNEELHTYMLNGKMLMGITGMIRRQLFPDEYKDIPKHILNHAAERGTKVHNLCEAFDENDRNGLFTPPSQVVNAYRLLRGKYHPVANEYTVTDGEFFASNIDCVWSDDDGNIILADIKTPQNLNLEYVSWQLSIYKYMFENQNKFDLHVSRLFAVRVVVDDDFNVKLSELVEVEDKGAEAISALLSAERNGEQYQPTALVKKAENPVILAQDAIDLLIETERLKSQYTEQYENIKNAALEAMKAHGIKSWDCEQLKMTYTPPTSAQTFDSTRFKKEHPDLYVQYMKTTERKETIKITIR